MMTGVSKEGDNLKFNLDLQTNDDADPDDPHPELRRFSYFNLCIFAVISVIYLVGGIWMIKLMKRIIVQERFYHCKRYLLKIIISGCIVSVNRALINFFFIN